MTVMRSVTSKPSCAGAPVKTRGSGKNPRYSPKRRTLIWHHCGGVAVPLDHTQPKISICWSMMVFMPQLRISEAARFLGVSDDTVRRWIQAGTLTASTDSTGRRVVDGLELARIAREQADLPEDPTGVGSSARNRFVGLVTAITTDTVMAQVEMQCGPHRVVSLMSSEAVRELGLELGSVASAVVKATMVILETPKGHSPT